MGSSSPRSLTCKCQRQRQDGVHSCNESESTVPFLFYFWIYVMDFFPPFRFTFMRLCPDWIGLDCWTGLENVRGRGVWHCYMRRTDIRLLGSRQAAGRVDFSGRREACPAQRGAAQHDSGSGKDRGYAILRGVTTSPKHAVAQVRAQPRERLCCDPAYARARSQTWTHADVNAAAADLWTVRWALVVCECWWCGAAATTTAAAARRGCGVRNVALRDVGYGNAVGEGSCDALRLGRIGRRCPCAGDRDGVSRTR